MPPINTFAQRLSSDVADRLDGALAFAAHLDRMRLPPDAEACVASLRQMVRDARDIVRGVMDLRDAQAGSIALSLAPVRLRELVDQIADTWRDRASAAGVTLLTAYDGHADLVAEIDRDRLLACIGGLVGHAISRGGGAIEVGVGARHEGDEVTLEASVRDGSGHTDNHGAPGGELGLALAEELAIALGGVLLGGDNAGPGATWTFTLRAPISRDDEGRREAPAATLGHILIVDDNATNRMVAEALCEGFDCTSETACDGLEALEAMRRGRFDVVLMDIKMPNMDGVQATAAIRALGGPAASTPILAMTANADPADIARYLAAGMQGVVEKPIKPEQLAAGLNAVLFGSRAEQAEETLEAAGTSPYNPASSRRGA